MQYTSNYNLITVEGTDVVNPLVQMNPNFTDIDAAMFANKQATIGTATEITVGTVHSITRTNTDSDYFRFTATSNWTSGDSMSVDGVAVSVFLTDGTTPGTGSYIINSEVFGMISGTRVTLFLANPEVNNIGDLADLTTTDKTSIVNAINEVNGKGIIELWSNPDITQSFATQNVDIITSDNISTVLIEVGNTSGSCEGIISAEVGGSARFDDVYIRENVGTIADRRRDFIVSSIIGGYRIAVGSCVSYEITTYGTAPVGIPSDTSVIPYRIFGIIHN